MEDNQYTTRGPGANAIRRIDSINKNLVMGDLGESSSLVRVRPFRQGELADQHLHHSGAAGIYINGTEASDVPSPIVVPAQATAVEYRITAANSARGTNILFELKDTNDVQGASCSARFYVPDIPKVKFSGPDGYVYASSEATLWVGMPDDTNACRVYMRPYQEPGQGYGIPFFNRTDRVLVKVTGSGAHPSETTLNYYDYLAAYGDSYAYMDSSARTRGIQLAAGSYAFMVGFDMNRTRRLRRMRTCRPPKCM